MSAFLYSNLYSRFNRYHNGRDPLLAKIMSCLGEPDYVVGEKAFFILGEDPCALMVVNDWPVSFISLSDGRPITLAQAYRIADDVGVEFPKKFEVGQVVSSHEDVRFLRLGTRVTDAFNQEYIVAQPSWLPVGDAPRFPVTVKDS